MAEQTFAQKGFHCSDVVQDQYQPFSTVTKRALLHALSQLHKSLTTDEIDGLLASYNSLSVYPDVGPAMGLLKDSPDVVPVIFSNGTEDMISKSMADSPDLRPHVPVFKSMVSVDAVARFKPDPKVYKHLAEQLGMGTEKEGMERIWLVSGNPFDVVGARAVGMHAAWVKRKGIEWCDALIEGELGKPTITVEGVEDAVRGILGATG